MEKIADIFLSWIEPFLRMAADIHWPFTRKKITGVHYYKWKEKILPGMVLLTNIRGELTNALNPSKIKHGAIYIGEDVNNVRWVMEATKVGVHFTDLLTFMTSKDIFIVVKKKGIIEADGEKIAKVTMDNFLKKLYDFLFKNGADSIYCFELPALSYLTIFPTLHLSRNQIGPKVFYDAKTYLEDKNNWEIVLDSRFEDKTELIPGKMKWNI